MNNLRKSKCASTFLREEKKHILDFQRSKRPLTFMTDKEVVSRSHYPGEYPSTHIPIPVAEVPNGKGRRLLAKFYANFQELFNAHKKFVWFNKANPETHISPATFVAPNATLIGDVHVGENSSIWYGAILRADKNSISIGYNTNIQDGVVITVDDKQNAANNFGAVSIGNSVTIGHNAKLHACTIGHNVIIGMGAVILEGAVIEDHAVIGACTVVPPGRRIPTGQVWAGSPAKFFRDLNHAELDQIEIDALAYQQLAKAHDLEFTSNGMLYKEVEHICETLEKKTPVEDERPVHWNVWGEMSKTAVAPFWKNDREYNNL